MIAPGTASSRFEDGSHPGFLLCLLELSAEREDDPAEAEEAGTVDAAWSSLLGDPGRSSALLAMLGRERRRPADRRPRAAVTGRVLGPYRLIDRLGQGSQAEVWRAVRIRSGLELVALKVLTAELARDPLRRERFLREAELGTRLSAPALLPAYESGEFDGSLYLALPLVEGGTLADVIAWRRVGSVSVSGSGSSVDARGWWSGLTSDSYIGAVVRVLIRIARSLAVVHAGRVAHRDVKPANILLERSREDRAFLCDFGLGRDLDGRRGPAPGHGPDGAGTPLYMAPEKLQGREVDEVRCDIYSLGVTLFEAVTLVHPFSVPKGLPHSCLPAYLVATTPPGPRDVMPWLPRSLEAIILRAMARSPSWRYPSASEFADDLDRFLVSLPGRWMVSMAQQRIPGPKYASRKRPAAASPSSTSTPTPTPIESRIPTRPMGLRHTRRRAGPSAWMRSSQDVAGLPSRPAGG